MSIVFAILTVLCYGFLGFLIATAYRRLVQELNFKWWWLWAGYAAVIFGNIFSAGIEQG